MELSSNKYDNINKCQLHTTFFFFLSFVVVMVGCVCAGGGGGLGSADSVRTLYHNQHQLITEKVGA